MTAKRPILAIGPEEGELSTILTETNAGVVINFDAEAKLEFQIRELYQKFREGKLIVNAANIQKYHRKELTKNLAFLLKSLNS